MGCLKLEHTDNYESPLYIAYKRKPEPMPRPQQIRVLIIVEQDGENVRVYAYVLNNPLKYTDPTGELAWFVLPVAFAVIGGSANVAVQAQQGNIDNFWQGLGYFAQGAAAGAVVGATWSAALASPLATAIAGKSLITGFGAASSGFLGVVASGGLINKSINIIAAGASLASNSNNAWRLMLGKYYTDENRTFAGGLLQGLSRVTWEGLQTSVGATYSHLRNATGNTDRVDYFGGATFSTDENNPDAGRTGTGSSLGNYINIQIEDRIEDGGFFSMDRTPRFRDRVLNDGVFMHEYGHTFDSHRFGFGYLPGIGIASFNAKDGRFTWTETRANRFAANYFGEHYGVDWSRFEFFFPQ